MIKQISLSLIFSVSLALSATANAEVFSPDCPKELNISQIAPTQYPGWRALVIQPHYFLNSITLYAGEPEKIAALAPETANDANAVWKFAPTDKIFIACGYNQTSIQLTQALPKHTSSCTVTYNQTSKSSNGYIPSRIECQTE